MKKVYNYTQFNVNERNRWLSWIHDKFLNNLSGWTKNFFSMLKGDKIRKIPSGSNKGKPFAMMFMPGQKLSIVQQFRLYKAGVSLEDIQNINYDDDYVVNEAAVGLKSDKFTNVNSKELKEDIMDYFKIKTLVANYYDTPKETRKKDDPARGMKAKPIFIFGAPGIGKTEIVAYCCDVLRVPLLFLDVQFMNPEDFKGIPSVHSIKDPEIKNGKIISVGSGFTRANPPSIFPRDNGVDGNGGIIFMDELNRSNPIVLNTMMQFVQQGRIGEEYTLPNKWCLVAAGNRSEDDPQGNITDVGTALTSRFSVVNYVPNYNTQTETTDNDIREWKAWAEQEKGMMPEIISFLQSNPDKFHYNDPDANEGAPFPSPRSWTEASKILYSKLKINNKNSWRDVDINYIKTIFKKEIGEATAVEFINYLIVLKNFTEQDMDMILIDSDKVGIPDAISPNNKQRNTGYIFAISKLLYNRIKEDKLDDKTMDKIYNLLKYFDRLNDGERYSGLYKAFIEKYKNGPNMMLHSQKNTTLSPESQQKRSQVVQWATKWKVNL